MASKDVKSLLKEAREAIKTKSYQASLKLCKTILKDDKENYMALVFLGLSLQEAGPTDQAPNAFHKAIQISPTNVLAWNGLANYYEKLQNNEAQEELIKIYISLLGIETTEKKLIELCEKLSDVQLNDENLSNAMKNLHKLAKNPSLSEETYTTAWTTIISVFLKYPEVPSSYLSTLEEALIFVTRNTKTLTKQYYSEYLKLLYKQTKYELLIEEADKMFSIYSSDVTPLEWVCKVFNELTIEKNDFAEKITEKAQTFVDNLLKINPESSMGLFTKAVFHFNSDSLFECKDLLKKVTSLRPGLLHAWFLLTSCYLKVHFYNEAVQSALKADKLLISIKNSNQVLRNQLNLMLVESLSRHSEQENWQRCINLCSNEPTDENNQQNLLCCARCYINLEKYNDAQECIMKLQENERFDSAVVLLNARLQKKRGNLKQALDMLEKQENSDSSEYWLELGLIYWDMELYEKSLMPFLKAAKLDQNFYLCFLHLGYYYQKFQDFDKARRCFEKAFRINENCTTAGIELSKIYRKQKNWHGNLRLLQNLTGSIVNTENRWAWLQLGLTYLEQQDYLQAISTLRTIVRVDTENGQCWDSLADAYLARGAYTSALKCYQRAAQLTPNSLYPLLQIANIKEALCQYSEAQADYENILLTNKRYVPALKGLAETCMHLAKQHKRNQLLGLSRQFAQYALDSLTTALQERSDLSCLWKLAADACFLVAGLPEKYCCVLVLAALAEGKPTDGNKVLECEDLYTLSARCYCKALSLVEDNILIWHDLAACYLSHGQSIHDRTHAQQLHEKALAVVGHCINKNPTHWQHWNLMGNILCSKEPKNYALAQHAFIKAVTIDHNSAVAWCNLGALYLIIGDVQLANEAFSQAQRGDPNYVSSWVGQALLAESLGIDDAMDLFRHSTQLRAQQQGAIGYGHWVCRTILGASSHAVLYSIHNMHAVPVACDALTWYTENNPNDPCAWNMLGILRERMGLKSGAAQAYRNALRHCDSKHRDICRLNYARLLMVLSKNSQAIDVYRDVKEATFNSGSGLALALFKDQQFEESYNAYESALHWLTEEQASQSDLLVALASMAYMFQGPDGAKTLLLQSTQLKPPSPFGLYGTLALGLLHDDIKLAQLVLKELHNLKDDTKCLQHYATLLSFTYLLQGEHTKAVRELSKLIHRHPNQPALWLSLSMLLIRLKEKRPSSIPAAARCAQLAMKLGQRTNMDLTKVLCVVSLASLHVKNYKESLKAAQHAVHCYPNVPENWVCLNAALQSSRTKIDSKPWLQKSYSYIKNHLSPSETLLAWLNRWDPVVRGT